MRGGGGASKPLCTPRGQDVGLPPQAGWGFTLPSAERKSGGQVCRLKRRRRLRGINILSIILSALIGVYRRFDSVISLCLCGTLLEKPQSHAESKKKADRAVSLPRSITLNSTELRVQQPSWFLVIKHILGGFA
jgi:hypothetical protein